MYKTWLRVMEIMIWSRSFVKGWTFCKCTCLVETKQSKWFVFNLCKEFACRTDIRFVFSAALLAQIRSSSGQLLHRRLGARFTSHYRHRHCGGFNFQDTPRGVYRIALFVQQHFQQLSFGQSENYWLPLKEAPAVQAGRAWCCIYCFVIHIPWQSLQWI